MDREFVFAILWFVVGGVALVSCGWWPTHGIRGGSARRLERATWMGVLGPLVPSALAVTGLLGWALVEPDNSEPVPRPLMVLAAFFAAHAARALLRAKRALKAEGEPLAATLGLLRPRVFISPRLAASLDSNALEAAREHERAHARHRDGLRIWLAQLATDLQWPWPAAQARLRSWLHALELARDEEARRRGTNGSDLAAAILGAVRIAQAAGSTPPAALLGAQDMLSDRLSRLLEPVCPEEGQRATRWYHVPILLGVLTLVAAVGARCGEPLVRWLLGTWN